MPVKNGLDFVRELCLRGNTTPFILFTGKGNKEVENEVRHLGAFKYFSKSGNPETVYPALISCIDEVIKESQVHVHAVKDAHKELDIAQLKQCEQEGTTALKGSTVEFVVLPFAHLKHICRFEKDDCCSETKKICNIQNCPHTQKRK
jgi:DNA-binding response OmpR family regulator